MERKWVLLFIKEQHNGITSDGIVQYFGHSDVYIKLYR